MKGTGSFQKKYTTGFLYHIEDVQSHYKDMQIITIRRYHSLKYQIFKKLKWFEKCICSGSASSRAL